MTNIEYLRRYIVYLDAMRQVTTSAIEDGGLDVVEIENMLVRLTKGAKEKLALLRHYEQLGAID